MKVRQLSVFLENVPGRMAAVTRVLAGRGLNLRAFCVADTESYGILRVIVDDPQGAQDALRAEGFTSSLTDVIAVEVPDAPGGLADVLEILDRGAVNIEYLYAFCEKYRDNALVIFRVEDVRLAVSTLTANGIRVVSAEEAASL
jgi:hypothetical protein